MSDPIDSATMFLADKQGKPLMYYRWNDVKYSDGDIRTELEYLTYANLWYRSGAEDPKAFAKRLKPIE